MVSKMVNTLVVAALSLIVSAAAQTTTTAAAATTAAATAAPTTTAAATAAPTTTAAATAAPTTTAAATAAPTTTTEAIYTADPTKTTAQPPTQPPVTDAPMTLAPKTTTTRTTTTTTTVDVKGKSLQFVVTINGLDFAKVDKDATFKAAVINEVRKEVLAVSSHLFVVDADVGIKLSSGSVKATVIVAPSKESLVKELMKVYNMDQRIRQNVADGVKKMTGVDKMLKSGKTTKDIKATQGTVTLVKGGVRSGGSKGAAVISSAKQASIASVVALLAYFQC